jgi:ATP-dependent helicase/DNAse subunit B
VLVRNLDGYHKPLARVFRRYGIPFFLDRRESVAHHPLAELTRSALRTVAFDWPHDDWFAALKAGFSPVDEAEVDRLENEALARGWHGAKWREPFKSRTILNSKKSWTGSAKKCCHRLNISPRNSRDTKTGRTARNWLMPFVNFGPG